MRVRSVLFEPTPIEPTSAGRRRALATVTIPVLVLVGVVGVALAGTPGGAIPAAREPDRADVALMAPPDAASPAADQPASAPGSASAPGIAADTMRFPGRVFDLTARSVADSLGDWRRDGSVTGLVAIRGWLSVHPVHSSCAPMSGSPSLTEDLCWEEGILADDPAPTLRWVDGRVAGAGSDSGRLQTEVPPGVSLWGLDANVVGPNSYGLPRGPIQATPVVVIGRFGDQRAEECAASRRRCEGSFVVERVVWTAGQWRSRPVVRAVDPVGAGLDDTASRAIAFQTFSGRTIVLSQTLLPASMLGRLDPTAATVITAAAGAPTADRLWYLRVMTPASNEVAPVRTVRWIAIDDGTGAILANWPAS